MIMMMVMINDHDYDDGHDRDHVGDQVSQSETPLHCFWRHPPDFFLDDLMMSDDGNEENIQYDYFYTSSI